MLSLRTIALGSFFGALATLEVAHGLWRLRSLREGRAAEILAEANRGQSELVRGLLSRLAAERDHARFLASMPSLVDLLVDPGDIRQAAAERDVLAYLVAFRDIDRVRALDEDGRERLRCERIGEGVGVLPPMRLASAPEPSIAALIGDLAPHTIQESSIVIDPQRDEMPPSQRQVIHFCATVAGPERRAGTLVLTVYAAPIVRAVAGFEPVIGARSMLVDALGASIPAIDDAQTEPLSVRYAVPWKDIEEGRVQSQRESDWLIARPLDLGEPTRVVTILSRSAIESALAPIRSESNGIIGSMIAVTLVIVVGAVFFVRLSLRTLKLRESERYLALVRRESAKWKALTECAADMILIVDPQSEAIRERNRMAEQVLGARSLAECVPPAEYATLRQAFDQALAKPDSPLLPGDLHVSGVGGEAYVFDPRLVAIDVDGERVVELALRDVTRERAMERQLSISERLTSLGLMTAGVAHEINNPLEGIGNYLALLARDEVGAERRLRYLESVRVGFERIRDLVRDLLSFARPGVGHGEADLAQVVARVCKLVGYSKPFAGIEVRRNGLDEPLLVAADPGRMEQVLLNLLINAATAMGGTGSIEISARRLEPGPADTEMIELCVDDEGPGIPEADLTRIFDPFFTTTQGTGLGLSISYGIIRAHGGRLLAANRPRGGARFTVELPSGRSPRAKRTG